ncbi:dihydrofolate reductase family protein [Jiangella mangrovi]|uniref:Dihydrofolate reductase n=1 Tax=Jiangella mangrovi TaxID=1524084 RepID=A0A7W9GXE2_9ACTN|nr:dihydrofolate reductase family protein [Jiangella mangrovi]MBB5791498.1 dihydrofolate reductase [Jiangella mangrovi]
MRQLVYYVASTLDGFVAGPRGEVDFFSADGDHMQAITEQYPETVPVHFRTMLGIDPPNRTIDTVLEGRGSYQTGLDDGVANAFPHLRHFVFSRTLAPDVAPGVEVVASDPVERVRELKLEPGERIWLCGGGEIAGALRDEIDELAIKIYPVAIGAGRPLFGTAGFAPSHLTVTSSRTFDDGVVFVHYTRG